METSKRPRIKARYGIRWYAAYAHYRIRKLYPQYTREDIHKCLMVYFALAQEDLAKGERIYLNNKLGSLYLAKEKKSVTYNAETGEIINTLPVNIPETLKLWKQKPELRGKRFVRFTNDHSNNFVFKLIFNVRRANYKNKSLYNFKFNKTLKKKLAENIRNKIVDAYIVPERNES